MSQDLELQPSANDYANVYDFGSAKTARNGRQENKPANKLAYFTKIMIIATVINFLLIIALGATFAYFESSANGGGAIYTRWGKSSCPDTAGTELLYNGTAGAAFRLEQGGGANYLCAPNTPEYSSNIKYLSGAQRHARLWAAQYNLVVEASSIAHNIPCAVCYVSTRPTAIMIPAKASCPPTWTREYYGYLMTAHEVHHRTTFECVDASQEPASTRIVNHRWGVIMYHVEAQCGTSSGGLSCSPYNSHQELNCVVCTK